MHRPPSLPRASSLAIFGRLSAGTILCGSLALAACSDGAPTAPASSAVVPARAAPVVGSGERGPVPSPAEVFGAFAAASLRLPTEPGNATTAEAARHPWFCPRPKGAVTLELTPGVYTPATATGSLGWRCRDTPVLARSRNSSAWASWSRH